MPRRRPPDGPKWPRNAPPGYFEMLGAALLASTVVGGVMMSITYLARNLGG